MEPMHAPLTADPLPWEVALPLRSTKVELAGTASCGPGDDDDDDDDAGRGGGGGNIDPDDDEGYDVDGDDDEDDEEPLQVMHVARM